MVDLQLFEAGRVSFRKKLSYFKPFYAHLFFHLFSINIFPQVLLPVLLPLKRIQLWSAYLENPTN